MHKTCIRGATREPGNALGTVLTSSLCSGGLQAPRVTRGEGIGKVRHARPGMLDARVALKYLK